MNLKKFLKVSILFFLLSTLLFTGCIGGCISYGTLDGYVYVKTGDARIQVRGLLEDIESNTYKALSGATVLIGNKTATTDSNGYFKITQIPTGTYSVSISADGYETLTITGVTISSGQTTHLQKNVNLARRKWNFLVYLDGDNNLESQAIMDVNEMEQIGSNQDVNIIVLVDRIPGYDTSNENWTTTRLYYITRDSNTSTISSTLLTDLGERDMSDPNTLRDFVIYCQNNFPAEKTCLTLWNHGGGVYPRSYPKDKRSSVSYQSPIKGGARGLCWDDTTGTSAWDCLTTDEVATALNQARVQTGKKIDVINMDVCLTQMIEVAYEWRNEANFLVGSEETVPGYGNDYKTVLQHLTGTPSMSAQDFAKILVDDYQSYYVPYNNLDTTYSYVNLGTPFTTLMNSFESFAQALYNTNDLASVYSAWQEATYFDYEENLDLYDFANDLINLSNDNAVKSAANSLKTAISDAVYYKNTGIYAGSEWPAYGLAAMLPSPSQWNYYSGLNQYVTLALSQDTLWDEFILRFVEYESAG